MSFSPVQLPSPCSDSSRSSSSPVNSDSLRLASSMLKIQSLLNPIEINHMNRMDPANDTSTSAPTPRPTPKPTPGWYHPESSAGSTPRPDTPLMSTYKRQKMVKDAAVFVRSTPNGSVSYPPYECNAAHEHGVPLEHQLQHEIAQQHGRFQIFPSGNNDDGLIREYARHIPYSSEKKSFLEQTGLDAFNVFQYTFVVPGDPEQRVHTVMWDYKVGLVRITPFFKACKYSKTTPAKALTSNAGLKELSHSITGGALAAQGYWMPYSCARAICLTFAYHIRWALTPIFGPSFIKQCLRPGDHGFGLFKIDPELVRQAGPRAQQPTTGDDTPTNATADREIPRSMPEHIVAGKNLRPRKSKPSFKLGSPFDADSEGSGRNRYTYRSPSLDSPELSPKSKHVEIKNAGWTSVNRDTEYQDHNPPPVPHSTPVGSPSLLLAEPRFSPTTSWRSAEPVPSLAAVPNPPPRRGLVPRTYKKKPTNAEAILPSRENVREAERESTMTPASKKAKVCKTVDDDNAELPRRSQTDEKRTILKTQADFRAARWLLNLSIRDAKMAEDVPGDRGLKRKASDS